MCNPERSLFDEPDGVLRNGAPAKRIDMLRRATDLFLGDADRLNDRQSGVFDQVLVHLIDKIETRDRLLRFWEVREASLRSA